MVQCIMMICLRISGSSYILWHSWNFKPKHLFHPYKYSDDRTRWLVLFFHPPLNPNFFAWPRDWNHYQCECLYTHLRKAYNHCPIGKPGVEVFESLTPNSSFLINIYLDRKVHKEFKNATGTWKMLESKTTKTLQLSSKTRRDVEVNQCKGRIMFNLTNTQTEIKTGNDTLMEAIRFWCG